MIVLTTGIGRLGSAGIAVDAVGAPRTPFEQYEALIAATALAPTLTAPEREQVREAIEEQRQPGGTISPRSDRQARAKQLLDTLRAADQADAATAAARRDEAGPRRAEAAL
jgi:hypothetical protein